MNSAPNYIPDDDWFENPLDSMPIATDNEVIDTSPSEYQPPGVDEEPPHITIHEKMYRLAIEKHNPLGSEGFQGGSEEIHI